MTQANFGQGKYNRNVLSGQTARKARRIVNASLIALMAGIAFSTVATPNFAPTAALAQNLFAPRLYVNGEVVTEYEVDQRIKFLKLLRAPGDLNKEAEKGLIDDRLRLAEAKRLKITLTEAERKEAAEEFAARANLSADQLLAELATIGIAPQTYRDFIEAGALWRKTVRAKTIAPVSATELEVDRALAATARPTALKLQVSELVIPLIPGREQEAMDIAQRLSQQIKSEAAFAAAAREYSAAPSAENGGRLADWLSASNLPPVLTSQLLNLSPGQTTQPLTVTGAVVLFQLRDIAKDTAAAPIKVVQEWAEVPIAGGAMALAQLRTQVDTCKELYNITDTIQGSQVQIKKASVGQTPSDIGLALAKLDGNEMTLVPRGNGQNTLVMLCNRQQDVEPEITRDQIKLQLMNQKLEGLANGYLAELRSAAIIRGK